MSNRCLLFLLILSVSFGYNPSPQKTPYSAQINTPVQKTNCGTESSPFNAQSPQEFHEPINSRTNRDVEIPINYHVIYVAGDSIFMNVTVDNVLLIVDVIINNSSYNGLADFNHDDSVDMLDVVTMLNFILNGSENEIVAEGRLYGKHVGEFQGNEATGKDVELPFIDFYPFDKTDKLISERVVMNLGALINKQQ